MKHRFLFPLFVAVCLQAQDAAKPAVQQSEPEAGDYYGAYAPSGESVFNHNPNGFLVECVRNRKPGKALDSAWVQAEMLSIWLLTDGTLPGSI